MRWITSVLALLLATEASAAPLAPAVRHDVQCFILFSMAVGAAEKPEQKTAATLAVPYYMGKIRTHSPGLDIAQAALDEIRSLRGSPDAERIGEQCDAEFQGVGRDLISIGERLQQLEGKAATT